MFARNSDLKRLARSTSDAFSSTARVALSRSLRCISSDVFMTSSSSLRSSSCACARRSAWVCVWSSSLVTRSSSCCVCSSSLCFWDSSSNSCRRAPIVGRPDRHGNRLAHAFDELQRRLLELAQEAELENGLRPPIAVGRNDDEVHRSALARPRTDLQIVARNRSNPPDPALGGDLPHEPLACVEALRARSGAVEREAGETTPPCPVGRIEGADIGLDVRRQGAQRLLATSGGVHRPG